MIIFQLVERYLSFPADQRSGTGENQALANSSLFTRYFQSARSPSFWCTSSWHGVIQENIAINFILFVYTYICACKCKMMLQKADFTSGCSDFFTIVQDIQPLLSYELFWYHLRPYLFTQLGICSIKKLVFLIIDKLKRSIS